MAGHSVDEYLETIYFLAFPIGEYHPRDTTLPTLSSRVAEMLGVSRASAGEMLKRMEADGLVQRGEHKEAILTKTGRERAQARARPGAERLEPRRRQPEEDRPSGDRAEQQDMAGAHRVRVALHGRPAAI